jgi:hypothetical protein
MKSLRYRAALRYCAAPSVLLLAACLLIVSRSATRADDAASAKAKSADGALVASLASLDGSRIEPLFAKRIRPLLAEYCLACHSTKEKKGELDLERFVSIDVARTDLKPWQSLVEMLDAGEMPPKGRRQPTADQRRLLIEWTRRWLDLEARSHVGDPGQIALRRLSNAEYDCTVRDLTGIDLQPAREFPADGAAGEGFTNASEALSMSSALFDKYLAAAKGIADHAVFLPDGFRFSPSSHQRDWTDASLAALRRFYGQYANADGSVPLEKYLRATIENRSALASGAATIAAVARQENLSAKYLGLVWKTLTDRRPSLVLDVIRKHWSHASAGDAAKIAAEIQSWENAAWSLNETAAGIYEPWQTPNQLVNNTQTIRLKVAPAANQKEVTLYLVARTIGDAPAAGSKSAAQKHAPPGQPLVVWNNARFEADKMPPLMLRDVPIVAEAMNGALAGLFRDTTAYLSAAAEWRRGRPDDSVAVVAKRRGLDPLRLQHWIDAAALSREVPGALRPLEVKLPGGPDRPNVSGWGSPTGDTLPILMANNSDRTEGIPGTLPGHRVVVHPSPDEYVAVAWSSPIAGRVRIEAQVADEHAGCGNGVAWWIDQQHIGRRDKIVAGEFDDGRYATIAPHETIVEPGDVVCLAVASRDHDDGCDLTLVDLTITELDGKHRTWNLSHDVADSVLAGNPHADRLGNKAVWLFAKGADNSPRTPRLQLPGDSLLAKWRNSLDRSAPTPDEAHLAEQLQTLLTGRAPPADGRPDSLLFAALVSSRSPLVDPADLSSVLRKKYSASKDAASAFGIEGTGIRGQGAGSGGAPATNIPESAFATQSPAVVKIRLPAAMVANREFIVDASLESASVGNRLVQLQVLASPPDLHASENGNLVAGPILCGSRGDGRRFATESLDDFRRVFPRSLCFSKIVAEDPVGITLCLFSREDDSLRRLMLDGAGQKELDRLWLELKYVGRQAQKENESFPLFMGFASQVGLVPKFEPMREPLRLKSAAFTKEMEASEPAHLAQLLDFAARANRRPLSDREKNELLAVYHAVRSKKHVSHEDAMRGVLARVLIAPDFLFHLETRPVGKEPKPVDDWALASRLSYFLWSSMPDDELRHVAACGRLRDPKILAEQTTRMLRSPKLRSLAIEFGTQWIHVRGFDDLREKNERLFPSFNAELRTAIYEESIRFFQDLFQSDRPLERILDANYTFLNESLAKHYGIPNVWGAEWRRVDGVQKYGRGGILALASVLTNESAASRTSPTLRGNWVSETLLGEKLPRPPPNVPKIRDEEDSKGGLSVRQIVERHASVAQCAVCHRRIDPLGFSLEQYDAIGRHRDKESSGATIDCRAKLKDGTEFVGIDGLRNYLLTKKRDVVFRLFCRRLLGYALGRETTPSDSPVVDSMMAAMDKDGGRISAAVLAIVDSPQFRLIRGSDE